MTPSRLVVFASVLVATFWFVGCGNSVQAPVIPPAQPTSVIFVLQPPASLAVNASATIDAAAIYPINTIGTETTAVTYSVSCGSAGACGAFSASPEGGAMVYTAPAAIPAGSTVTITATSVANTSLSASTRITIVPPIPISITFAFAPPASVQIGSSVALSAIIANDVSANPQVQWTVSCGSAGNCGSFSASKTTSTEATMYTAPTAIPSSGSVTVTATSLTDSTKSISATIVITAAAPTLADGTYVFQVSGTPSSGALFATGAFVAKGGSISSGEQDEVVSDGDGDLYSQSQQISGGSYATAPDGNLAINLQIGAGQAETLYGTLAAGGKGLIAGINGAPSSGNVDLQTSTVAPAGGFAFSLGGNDLYASPAWIGGVLNVDGNGTISGNGSTFDVIDGPFGAGPNPQTLTASTVSAPDAFGRVLFTLNPGPNSGLPQLEFAGYMIDGSHLLLSQVGNPNNSNYVDFGVTGGTALAQGATTGKFDAATIAGSSYVIAAEGEDVSGPLDVAGVLTFNSGGSVTGTLSWNDLSASVPKDPVSCAGTWTVDPTGRVTISNLTDGTTTLNYSFYVYLAGGGSGFVLSASGSPVFSGEVFERQSGTFTAASFSGNYGVNAAEYSDGGNGGPAWSNTVGSLVATPGSNAVALAGYVDSNANPADTAVSGSFASAANGIFSGTLQGLGPATNQEAGDYVLYFVSPTQAIVIETDTSQLTLGKVAGVE